MSKAAKALARRRWAKRDIKKTCLFCGQDFLGDPVQRYCTPAHQNAAAVRRFRERRALARPSASTGAEDA